MAHQVAPAVSDGIEDSALVRGCPGGDREAFRVIVERYQNLVRGIAYSACGGLAKSEDIAQETFIAAWTQHGRGATTSMTQE